MISENKRIKTKDITGKGMESLSFLVFVSTNILNLGTRIAIGIACAIAVMKKWYQAIV